MNTNSIDCLIVTSAHDPEDGRIQRHLHALARAGLSAGVWVAPPRSRFLRLLAAPALVWRAIGERQPAAVLLPDPDLFVLGAAVARARGVRVVVDIHEDYVAVALDREWVPHWLRRGLAAFAALSLWLSRRLATAIVVAAAHLAREGDRIVTNVPDPDLFPPPSGDPVSPPFAVYVGDITGSRGAMEMAEMVAGVPELRLELIGPVTEALRVAVDERADELGCADRINWTGRLSYRESWRRARGAVAGLALLRPTHAYRAAMPTKLWEYAASGIPLLAAELPAARSLVVDHDAGAVVDSPGAAAATVRSWLADRTIIHKKARRARAAYESEAGADPSAAVLVEAVTGGDYRS